MVENAVAGIALTCGHVPYTDEEKWNNPLDCWCEEHHMMCCRNCFDTIHKTHKYHIDMFTDIEWQTHVESISGSKNDFSPDAPSPAEIATSGLSDIEVSAIMTKRDAIQQKIFLNQDLSNDEKILLASQEDPANDILTKSEADAIITADKKKVVNP